MHKRPPSFRTYGRFADRPFAHPGRSRTQFLAGGLIAPSWEQRSPCPTSQGGSPGVRRRSAPTSPGPGALSAPLQATRVGRNLRWSSGSRVQERRSERACAGPRDVCSLRRSVALPRRAPRRPRRRRGHTAHLLPLSPPPPPRLDGGPRPTRVTQKRETRRRRRRPPQSDSPDPPASPRSRRRGPAPAVPAVETPPSPPRPGLPGHPSLRSHSHSGPRAAPCSGG